MMRQNIFKGPTDIKENEEDFIYFHWRLNPYNTYTIFPPNQVDISLVPWLIYGFIDGQVSMDSTVSILASFHPSQFLYFKENIG